MEVLCINAVEMICMTPQVIQVYIRWVNPSSTMPNIQLAGVYRTTLLPNQDTAYTFEIRPHQMAIWDDDEGFVVEPGMFKKYKKPLM